MPKPKPKRVRADSREGMVSLLVALPRAVHRSLARIKKQTGATMNELVRRAVESWLRRESRKERKP